LGEDVSVPGMQRVGDPSDAMDWLLDRPATEAVTGFDAGGWPVLTWVLHALYENRDLVGLGTHDELHRRRLASGDVAPVIIGDVDLDAVTTVTGTALGFVIRPGQPWARITWAEYLSRFPDFAGRRNVPPCFRWFPSGSWPVAVQPPPEGSLDQESLEALVEVLARHSAAGPQTRCFAYYASLPAQDFDTVHLWEGPLGRVHELIGDNGGPYDFSPTNLWPADRAWFIWTDYDLEATKVSGDQHLIDDLKTADKLECLDWQPPTGG